MKDIGIFILAVCLRSLRGFAKRLLQNEDRKLDSDWLSEQVSSVMEEKKPAPSFGEKLTSLSLPEASTVWKITGMFALSVLLSWGVSSWDPGIYGLDTANLLSIYTTLWQVDAGISSVALPILLFVIELSKDQMQAAARSHEILIRETKVFPITLFSLLGTVRIGLDIAWFQKPGVFALDVLVFMATVGLTVWAYYVTLRLLFSPVKMRNRAMRLIREKMSDSLDASIELRLANNILFKKLNDLNVGYWPLAGDRRESEKYHVVPAPREGILVDVNLRRLEIFVRELQSKRRQMAAEVVEGTELSAGSDDRPPSLEKEDIWIMRRYGERIRRKTDGLIRLRKDAFDELAPKDLQTQLGEIVRIKAEDEI